MNDDEKKVFVDELKAKNDPIEEWPLEKIKRRAAESDDQKGKAKVRDDLGIE